MSRAFIVPRQILTGSGALEAAAPLLGSMGTHALIVTGQIVVTLEGKTIAEYPIRASEAVARLGFGGAFWKLLCALLG